MCAPCSELPYNISTMVYGALLTETDPFPRTVDPDPDFNGLNSSLNLFELYRILTEFGSNIFYAPLRVIINLMNTQKLLYIRFSSL